MQSQKNKKITIIIIRYKATELKDSLIPVAFLPILKHNNIVNEQ